MASDRRLSCAFLSGWTHRLTLCALVLLIAWPTLAQVPGTASRKPVIEEFEVPASQPDLWPQGLWQPVPREGYREFLADFERPDDSAPSPVPVLETLTLDATLAADSLIGTFTGEVTLPGRPAGEEGKPVQGAGPGVLDLTGTELALSSLQWDDEPAIWGVGPEDRLLVATAPPKTRLVGQWSLRGSVVFDALEFRVMGLPALASRIRLTLPASWSITADSPVQSSAIQNPAAQSSPVEGAASPTASPPASPKSVADAEGTRVWTIDLGHRRRTRLTVHRPGLRTAQAGHAACESDTVFSVTRGGGGLDSVTDLQLLGSPSSPIELDVPRELQVTSVLLGEIPIRLRREPGETVDRVTLDIPKLEGDTRALLRVRANQAARWGGKPISVAELSIRGIPPLRKGVTLRVDRPMELQSLQVHGLEQTDVSADGVRETYVFNATSRDTNLQIAVSEPEVRLTTDCWVLADLRGENPVVWQVWSLQSAAGETYRLDVPVPEPWEVVQVAPVSEIPESALSQWNFEKKGTQGGVLSVEFRRGLTPQTPKRILLELRGQPIPGLPPAVQPQAAQPAGRSTSLPILVPPVSRDVMTSVAIWAPEGMEARPPVNSVWKKGTVENLPAAFFQLGGTLVRNLNFDQAEYLTAESRRGPPELKIEPRRLPIVENLELRPPAAPRGNRPPRGEGAEGEPLAHTATRLEVTTLLGAPGAADHIHTAEFEFSGAIRLADLVMILPGGLRPVSIQDDRGEIAFAVNDGRLVFGEPQRQAAHLRFEYRTVATPGWLLATEQVAFPQMEGFRGPFVWRIDLSGRRAFLDTDLPWSTAAAEQVSPRWWQILGPLARRPGERIFNPLRREDWRALILPNADEARDADEILHVAPSVPSQVILRTYLVPRMRSLAWAFFLGCLVVGAFARRARLRLVRQVGYYSMALFVPLAWFLPPLYGIQMGAIASGLTLIYLVPRSIVVRDQFWRPRILHRPDKLRAAAAAAATGLLVAVSILGAQEAPVGPTASRQWQVLIPTEDGQRQSQVLLDPSAFDAYSAWKRRSALPAYLLEAARYAVTDDGTRLSGKAEIDVTLIETALPVTVRLPFDRVTLDAGASCHVDGHPVRVRPAADGKSILVPFASDMSGPAGTDGVVTEPPSFRRSKVVLDFIPRTDQSQPQRLDLVVPAAGDTRFTFRSKNTDPGAPQVTIDSRGISGSGGGPISTPEPGTWITALGARGTLSVAWSRPAAVPVGRGLVAQSLVTLSPLSADVRTRIEFPPSSSAAGDGGSDRSLLIPAAAVVDSVAGTALERYQVARGTVADERRIDVRFAPQAAQSPAFVDIHFRFPFDASAGNPSLPPLVRVSALPLEHHRIGFVTRGMPPLVPTVRPEDSALSLPVPEFTQLQPDELIWPVPEHCIDQPRPGPIFFTTAAAGLPRSARIRQGVMVDRTQTHWTGLMELQPRHAPLLSHELRLDPRVTLSSLSVEQDGAERLVRSLRQGDRLTLFVRSQTLDPLTIRAEGTLSGDRLNWSAPPAFGLVDGETLSSDVTVRNESGWLLEVEEGGAAASGTAAAPVDSSPRPVVIDLQTLQPARFRLRPGPDAADAEMWVRVVPWGTDGQGQGGQIGVTWHYAFTPVDGPLHIVTGRLPASIASHVVSSSVPIKPENATGDLPVPFSLSPSSQTPQHNELTIQAVLPAPASGGPWEIPEPSFDSARVTKRRLVAAKTWPLVPVAGSATTVADLRPADLPSAWRGVLKPADYEAYVGRGSVWQFEPRGDALPADRVRTPLVEAIVWEKAGEPLRGRTRIVAVTEHGGQVRIEVPAGLRITTLERRGLVRTLPGDDPQGEGTSEKPLLVRIDPARSPEVIVVSWQGDVPEQKPRLEVPRPAGHESVLIALIPARQQISAFESGRGEQGGMRLDPVAGGLAHFANLLDVVRQQRTRAWSLDDPLLESLRQMKRSLQETIRSKGSDLPAASAAQFEKLAGEWKELQQTLPVNAPSPLSLSVAPVPRTAGDRDLMTELLVADTQVQVGEYFKAGAAASGPGIKWSASRRGIELAFVVACGVSLLLLLRRLDRLQRRWETAEWVAGHAFVAMAGLGLFWWLALSPSAMGAAIVLATGFVKLLHVAGHRRAAQRPEESAIVAFPSAES